MKKVAFLLCSETIGGHEFQSIEFYKSSLLLCNAVLFLNIKEHKALIKDENIQCVLSNIPFISHGNFISQFWHYFLYRNQIRKLLSGYDKIIICAGTVEAGISCAYSLKRKNIYLYVPMFVDRKELWGRVGVLYNYLLKLFTMPYNGIVTINDAQGEIFSSVNKVFVLPNKIEKRELNNIKELNKSTRLYFIGRLERQKRVVELIKWLDHPDNKYDEFVIVGEGDEKAQILEEQKKLKHIKISLLEWLSPIEQEHEFSKNDVFVINSAYEGEPLVIREANNRGSVVIARDILGNRNCTHRENRFNNQESLLDLLSLAHEGKLKRYYNQPIEEIDLLRKNAIEQIFQ